jgi:phosphotransferase system  glucose/maltose/N-acetylglucosamine-specific IIC component
LAVQLPILGKTNQGKNMNQQTSGEQDDTKNVNQTVGYSKGNVSQNAGNISNNTNINLLIPLFFVSILALGGIAWAVVLGLNPTTTNQQIPQQEQQPTNPSPAP